MDAVNPDEVVGVFESGGLSNGVPAGYRFLFTGTKLVGQKAWIGQYHWWATHPEKSTDEKVQKRASKLTEEITSKKQFEFNKADLELVELKWPPSFWKAGYIKFKATGMDEITIKTSSLVPLDFRQNFTNTLQSFAGDKLHLLEK